MRGGTGCRMWCGCGVEGGVMEWDWYPVKDTMEDIWVS